jgi:hypothetical protein
VAPNAAPWEKGRMSDSGDFLILYGIKSRKRGRKWLFSLRIDSFVGLIEFFVAAR